MERFKRSVKRALVGRPTLFHWARRVNRLVARAARRLPSGAANYWNDKVVAIEGCQPQGWLDWQIIEDEYIRPQISGDPKVGYLEYLRDRHLDGKPVARALSLGCGGGNLERAMLALGLAEHIDAIDVSDASIASAQELATHAGLADRLSYRVNDIDTLELPATTYDLVICKMSLHHFEALEHLYPQIARSLRPGGVFAFNEFVGPTRFQWTDEQLEEINRQLEQLPREIRSQVLVPSFVRPTIREMIEIDPSESIRSADIMPLLPRHFEIVEHKPYGGTVLNLLLSEAMPAFDLDQPSHLKVLRELFERERQLISTGALGSDFAFVVSRPRPLRAHAPQVADAQQQEQHVERH